MAYTSRLRGLNVCAALVALYAWIRVVALPFYRLVSPGLRPHGSFEEDDEFFFGALVTSLSAGGGYIAVTLCILGIGFAMGSRLGFWVGEVERSNARKRFWIWPTLAVSAELLGRFLLQVWYARRGVPFPSTTFIRDSIPHLLWLFAALLLLTPAIRLGRGLYVVRLRDLRTLRQVAVEPEPSSGIGTLPE